MHVAEHFAEDTKHSFLPTLTVGHELAGLSGDALAYLRESFWREQNWRYSANVDTHSDKGVHCSEPEEVSRMQYELCVVLVRLVNLAELGPDLLQQT